MSNRPIDKINIGYNKSNEEYIGLMNEKNKLKKEIERSKEYQEKAKIQEKEQGFNIHINGANEDRIREQRKQEILRQQHRAHSNQDNQSQQQQQSQDQLQNQKIRRMWKNPNSVENRQSEMSQEGHPKYHNPFEIPALDKKNAMGENSPPKLRKKWGQNNQPGLTGKGGPTKAIHHIGKGDEEDDYSDSFEEIPQDFEDCESEEEKKEEEPNDIEQFLRTATMKDINDLKQSLSNFGGILSINKNFKKQQEDDEYIEEDFEEHDSDEDERLEQELKRKQEEEKKILSSQVLVSKNVANKNAKNRPISATFSLEQTKVQKNDYNSGSYNYQIPMASVRETQPKYQQQLSLPESNKVFGSSQIIQQTPKQPNDFMKKPLNTNPFQRPFSQNVPKREEIKTLSSLEQAKDMVNQSKTSDLGFKNNSNIPVQMILQKIEQLDDWQKGKLMEILDNLDNVSLQSSQVSGSNKDFKQKAQDLDFKFLSPQKVQPFETGKLPEETKKTLFGQDRAKNELIIRVLKTYGYPHLCGLTEIEVFDTQGKKVTLVPACIVARNLGSGTKVSMGRLIDGHKMTNDEKHMWVGSLPMPPQNLEILIYLNKEVELGGLKIWNYNKSAIDCTKGIKEVQILLNENLLWQGQLESGRGHQGIEYATFIELKEGLQLPREIPLQPQKIDIVQQAIEEAVDEEDESKTNIQVEKEMPEEMRKYRSELNMKQRPESTPFWLSQNKNQAQGSNINRGSQQSQDQQRRQSKQESAGLNTFDLLDKFTAQKDSTAISNYQSSSSSQNVSSRPHPLRDQHKGGQSAANLIKHNAGLGNLQSKSKPDMLNIQVNSKQQWTQPFSVQNQAQLQETSDAIKQAVNKVNMIAGMQQPPNRQRPIKVEESLDNLDFFKVTNLGRLINEQENKDKSTEKKQRGRWGQSPSKGFQDSQLSASKHKSAHVIVKNPFPEAGKQSQQQPMSSRRNISIKEEEDILDQILHKEKQQPAKHAPQTERNILWPSQTDHIHHLQFGGSSTQQIQDQKKQSISPARGISQDSLSYKDKMKVFGDSFIIPNLPSGQKLHFNILSTWGDMNYVGLTGIEIFDNEGKQVKIEESDISACPPDINILPNYGGDPRTIDKLIDGHYFTNDDLHVWLTPFTAGEDHTITIDLKKNVQVAMIRIWNYNKSRIHSYRGARLITCELDNKMIFRGEIQKAPGNLNDPQNCCELIVFTENDNILYKIDDNDWVNEKSIQSSMEDTQKIMQDMPSYLDERPMTATKKFSSTELEEIQRQLKQQKPTSLFDERPQTSAIVTGDQEEAKHQTNALHKVSKKHQELSNQIRQMAGYSNQAIKGRVLELSIVETWGDLFYVGLTGIEVLNENGQCISIEMKNVSANPRDMNSIPGHGSDYRTLDKLFNKVNNTQDDNHMWLIPFNKGENHTIKIDFGKQIGISAIRFYNYNKSEEDTLRGAKQVIIQLDKKYITPKKGVTVRKAPGLVHPLLSMGQEIKLPVKNGWTTDQIVPVNRKTGELGLFQEYELLNLPMGFMFKFNLYSTHGDFYYIGLNGLELYDQNGYLIKIDNIIAQPQGVHTLHGMESDVRVVKNLINNKNQTYEELNMWLAPFKNTRSYTAATASTVVKENDTSEYRVPNYIYVVFDEPKAISAVKLWNYSKTPNRGVNEFEILVDDKQIYRGFAKQAPEKAEFDKAFNKDFSTVVLFTAEDKIVEKFKNNINYDISKQQQVTLVNEKKIMNKTVVRQRPEEEFVVFNEMQRPTTMAKRQ